MKLFSPFLFNIKAKFNDSILNKIIKNSSIILFGNSAASLINLISFTIIARQLGPKILGMLVLAQTYVMVVNDIFNIQTWEAMIKFGSSDENKSIIKTNIYLDCISAVVAFSFALALLKPVVKIFEWDSNYITVYSIYCFSILFKITTLTIGIPRLFDKFLSIAKINVIVALIKLGSILYVKYYVNIIAAYIYIYIFADIVINLSLITYSLYLLNDSYGNTWWKEKIKLDKNQIKFIWWTNLRTITRIPVRYFDILVISSAMSLKMVGIYKVYKEIAGMINRIGEPINQAIYPEFTRLIGDRYNAHVVSVIKKVISILFCVATAATLFLLLSSKIILIKFFGVEYLEHVGALYLMLIFFGFSFITVPINSLFIAAGFAKYSFYIILLTNILYLLSAFYLGAIFGIYGVISAYAIQMIINKGLKIYFLNKHYSTWSTIIR